MQVELLEKPSEVSGVSKSFEKQASSKSLQEAINVIPQSTQELLKEHFRTEYKGIIKISANFDGD